MGYYDVAQICPNGHVTNAWARDSPEHNQNYCDRCGEKTIVACPSCNAPIQGHYHSDVIIIGGGPRYSPPAYCQKCGGPFPWTRAALEAAAELADTLDDLSKEEQADLQRAIPDLVRDTAKTPVAETRFKRLMMKVSKDSYEGMKTILINVVTEAVRRRVFGPQG